MEAMAGKPAEDKEPRTLRELRAECKKAGVFVFHDAFKPTHDSAALKLAGLYRIIVGYPIVVTNTRMSPMIRRRILADALKVVVDAPWRKKTEYWLASNGKLTAQFDVDDRPGEE